MLTSAEITLGGTVRENENKSKGDQQQQPQQQQQQQHSLARQGTVGSESTQVSYSLVRRQTTFLTRLYAQSTNSIGSPETDRTKLIWSLVFKNVGKWVDSWIKEYSG